MSRTVISALALAMFAGPSHSLVGQEDVSGLVMTAVRHFRPGTTSETTFRIDVRNNRVGPAFQASLSENAARALGVASGRKEDVLRCNEASCSLNGTNQLITVQIIELTPSKARVQLDGWQMLDRDRGKPDARIFRYGEEIELEKTGLMWKVARVLKVSEG